PRFPTRRSSDLRLRANGAQMLSLETPRDLVCQWVLVAHTQLTLQQKILTSAIFLDVLSVLLLTQVEIMRCAWLCKPASNTYAATKRPQISVQRKPFWRLWHRFMRCIMVRQVLKKSRQGSMI